MSQCFICSLEFDDTDLTRHYLKDPELIEFIRDTHKDWNPTSQTCSRCLETYYREMRSKELTQKLGEEQTVVTRAQDLLPNTPEDQHQASLINIHGSELGKKFDLVDAETIIGRSEDAHIRIVGENVSRQHAKVYKMGREVIIEDLKSTNGTFVNTRKITSQPLRDGDLVLIGNTILKFISGSNVEQQYHEEIYRLATIDGLTGLYNKAFFLEKLENEFSRSQRYSRDLSVILFDFDHFKNINDTYGHLAGDEILKRAATLILHNMRKEDICGRYGGEEFGVLLPEIAPANASYLAEKIRKLIETTQFQFNQEKIRVTISVGTSSLNKDVTTAKALVERADRALYRAKADGRNCVRTE